MNQHPEKLDLTSLDIAAGQREKLRQNSFRRHFEALDVGFQRGDRCQRDLRTRGSLLLLASGGASSDNLTPCRRPVTGIFPEDFQT